ncbi:MAG: O-antigen ligase family protein [Rhodocyclaceae bacterium]
MISLLRDNWRWLLILSAMPLFATKTLFNAPMIVMLFIGGWLFFRAPGRWLADPAARLLLALFLCFEVPLLLSLPDAVNLERSAGTALDDLRFFFAGIFVIEVLRNETARRRLFWGVGLIGVIWSLDALLQMVVGYDLLGYPYNGSRPTGIFHPKLRIGTVTATLSPLLFEAIRLYARRRRWAWLGLPVVLAIIFVSGNRNAWMMLTVAIFLYLIYLYLVMQRAQWLNLVGGGSLVLTTIMIGLLQYPPMHDRMQQTLGVVSEDYQAVDNAIGFRMSLWKTAFNMYQAHWINGVGPRGFRYVYVKYAEPDDFWVRNMQANDEAYPQTHPHQMLLEIAAETGSLGLAGFVLMAFLYLRAALTQPMDERSHLWPWVIAVLVAWFPGNAHMAIYASYWGTIAWWLLIVSIGMLQFGVSARRTGDR